MYPITDKQLTNDCKLIVSYYENTDLQLFTLFSLLYRTGVRIHEALEVDRWFMYSENLIALKGLKNANLRFFTFSDLPIEFQNIFTSGSTIFNFISYTSALRYLNRASKRKLYYNSGRALNFHMFRHNYIRMKNKELNDVNKLLVDLGKVKSSDITTYLATQIYAKI